MAVDPAVVAAHYQAKGYTVREGARVTGLSGNEHRVPLLCEGPLGNLAVFFGDFGGIDGPEMGGARRVARDLGATPVLAADEFSNQDRQAAARLGVVLLDGSLLEEDEPPRPAPATPWPGPGAPGSDPRAAPEPHPWPASGRAATGGVAAVDIEALLADTRRPRGDGAGEAAEPLATGSPAGAGAAAMAAAASDEGSSAWPDPDGLWKRPRRTGGEAAAGASVAGPTRGGKFAWLEPASAKPASAAPRDPLALDYDEVVASRREPRGAGPAPSDQGTAVEAAAGPDAEQATGGVVAEPNGESQARSDRMQRRVFWLLFAFVFVYLFWLFWTNRLF